MATSTKEQTILLVDEDLDFLDWATKHLEAKGLRILRCDNSENAIKVADKTDLDLIISDIQLQPYDGLELLSRFRAKNTNAVVVLTAGFPTTSQIIEATRRGARDVLRKESAGLRQRIPKDLPSGILHGDLFPDNVIGSGGDVVAILDLEEAWIGPLVFDLAMSFVGFGWHDNAPIGERWGALVEGYESVRELNAAELAALPDMHRYATLAIAGWRYWKHNLESPDPGLGGRYREMVERLDVPLPFLEGRS